MLRNPGLLPLAALSNTSNPENVLNQVAREINQIPDNRTQTNVTVSTAILANLVLEKDFIRRVLRSDIMRESPMYQEILEEGREEGREEALQ